MLAETLVYLILDTSWVANMLIQSDMTPHIICLWEEDRNTKVNNVYFLIYMCASATLRSGRWWEIDTERGPMAKHALSSCQKWLNCHFLQMPEKLAFRRYVWDCIWIWASHKLCLRWANWNNCSLDGKIELIAAQHCARKKEFCGRNGAGEVSMVGRGMAIGFAVCPPRSEK